MFRQFKFEDPIYSRLEQIPISTQFKLETLRFIVSLEVWSQLALEERSVLCHLPIRSRGERECYCDYLAFLFRRLGLALVPDSVSAGLQNKPWDELDRLPAEVAQKMRSLNLPLFWPDWIKLDDMERYTVYKFCHEGFVDAQIQQVVHEFLGLPSPPGFPPQ